MRARVIRLPLCVSLPLAAASALAASGKLDLDRVVPVPATEPIPVMDFFRPALLADPKLNLAGTHFAARASFGRDNYGLVVHDLEKGKSDQLKGFGDQDIFGCEWLTNDRLIFSLIREKYYLHGMMAAEIGHLGDSYPLLQFATVYLLSVPVNDRLHPLVWIRSDWIYEGRDDGVAKLNAGLKRGGLVATTADWFGAARDSARQWNQDHVAESYPQPGGGMTVAYLPDKEGELAFAVTIQEGFLTLHRYVNDGWQKCPVNLERIDIMGCGDNPGQLVVLGPRELGKPRPLQFLDAATGRLGEVLLQGTDHDFIGWFYRHPASHNILGAFCWRSRPRMVWFSDEYRAIQKTLDDCFPGLFVHLIGSDQAEQRFLVSVWSDRQPPIYYLVDLKKPTMTRVKGTAPWIDPARMRPMDVMPFKTRDGHPLEAYVTLPAGSSKQHPAPLVVLPHGGPFARDNWGFNGEAQFLASRGYAVLQPNYRGSPGYGWSFSVEEGWDFRKMCDDVTDATKALLATGLVDPQRIGIMGSSFGAYQALSGVVNEPNLYRCAVAVAGVFDWEKIMKDEKYNQFDNASYATLKRWLGDPKRQAEKFEAIAPLRHVDQVKVPVFVAHGKDDPVVDYSQSRQLIAQLDKYHIPHESLIVGGEGHGMQHLGKQVELYTRIEGFLAKYLRSASPAVTGPTANPP
jgi:acetyl esterase/lipase